MSFDFKPIEQAVARLKLENPTYTFFLRCSLIGSGLGGIVEIDISAEGNLMVKSFLVPRPGVSSVQDYMTFIQIRFTDISIHLPAPVKSHQPNDLDAQV